MHRHPRDQSLDADGIGLVFLLRAAAQRDDVGRLLRGTGPREHRGYDFSIALQALANHRVEIVCRLALEDLEDAVDRLLGEVVTFGTERLLQHRAAEVEELRPLLRAGEAA